MRKLLLLLIIFLNYGWASAQTFQEDFDLPTINFNFTPGWTVDTSLWVSGPNSMNGQYTPGGGCAAETQVFSLTGNNYVKLEFDQICKIPPTDTGIVEVSINGGQFVKLVHGVNCWYQGPSTTFINTGKFSSNSYPAWKPAPPDSAVYPDNTWWRHEVFDISQIAANASAIKIRWRAHDGVQINGMQSGHGWNLDHVTVNAAPCELEPPTVSFAGYTYFDCDVYNLGPFDVYVDLFDSSGILQGVPDSTEIYWTVNGGPVNQFGGLVQIGGTQFAGQIWTPVADGDTVCWWLSITDNSGCGNTTRYPANGCVQFVVHDGFKIPFCDNFDCIGSNWTDSLVNGSAWKRMFPQNPPLIAPHSAPNAWGVGADSVYANVSESYLMSPVFDFTGINAMNMSFWYQSALDGTSEDGVYLEYSSSLAPAWNRLGILNDPQGTNWYNGENFSLEPYFTGSTNGWVRARYKLGTIANLQNATNVQFRFVFKSDGFGVAAGFLVDDFCIIEAAPEDAGVAGTVSPACGGAVGANSSVSPQITIENFGTNPISNVDIFYSVNNGTPVQFTYTGTIAVASTANVTLPVFTSPSGSYGICFWTNYPNDGDHSNDTVCCSFIGIPTLTPPMCDNFDGANNGWQSVNGPNGSQINNWELGNPTQGGATTHNGSAGAWDINLGGVNGVGYDNNAESYLYSPFFDFSAVPAARLRFWLNEDSEEGWDGTRIDYSPDGGVNWTLLGDTVPSRCGTNWYNDEELNSSIQPAWTGLALGWMEATYKFCCQNDILLNPNLVQFRFVFTSDGSVVSGFGATIDDFCIEAVTGTDIGVTAIVQPASSLPAGSPTTVVVTVENFGATIATSFDVTYTVNGQNPLTTTFSGSLPPCGTTQITLPSTTFVTGPNTICAYTTMAGDQNASNDTACVTLVGIPTLIPTYCDDFDSGNNIWVAENDPSGNPANNWELGTPAFNQTTGTHSGANAWDINLTTSYTDQAFSILYSPYFDVSSVTSGQLNFWVNYNTETNWDGVRLEFTNDQGATWNLVGGFQDPCGTNWFDIAAINSSNLPAWAGNSNGWKHASYKLCCVSNLFNNPTPIQFRFVFTSDFSVTVDGFSIDDFCFNASSGDDVGISAITAPVGGLPAGTPIPVIVTIENYGSTTITSTPVTYTINGQNPVTVTWTGSLAPCTSTSFQLPDATFNAGVNTLCAWTSLPTDVNSSNDTTCTDLIGQPTIVLTYQNNYSDNFDNGNIGWAPEIGPGADPSTIWELGFPNWQATFGAHSGNTAWDVNLNTGVGPDAFAILKTPYFDMTNAQAAVISWWQNLQLDFGETFYIDYAIGNGGPWQRLGTQGSPNGTNWFNGAGDFWAGSSIGWLYTEYKDITPFVGLNPLVQFRFVLETPGFTVADGVSIDDFNIMVPIPLSVSPVSVNTAVPNQLIFPGQNVTFAAPVRNNGVNQVFNHNITLTVDGNVVSTGVANYNPAMAYNDTNTYTFGNQWNASPGNHIVCVYTSSPNGSPDLAPYDDTTCSTISVFDSIPVNAYPFCEDFDSPNSQAWISLNAFTYARTSNWEEGHPNQTNLNNAHSGNNAWTVSLDNNYDDTDSSGLFTSLLRVQQQHCYKFSFWQQYRMEYGSDGGTVEYSDDYGATWKPIDFKGSPNIVTIGPGANYTFVATLSALDPALRGFTGFQNTWFWTEKTFRPDVDSQILLRFRFSSDYSTTDEGWSIDDFCWTDLGLCTPLGVDEFVEGDFGMSQNYPNPAESHTSIDYVLPSSGQVSVVLTDMIGQTIAVLADGQESRGTHTVNYDASKLAPGMYAYTLKFDGKQITKRMIVTH